MGHSTSSDLPKIFHFYFYGIQGFCYEIMFTSLTDFFKDGNWELKGHSAISSFFIYGTCSFFVEHLYAFLYYKHNIHWYIRMPLYVLIAYTWELSWGLILSYFNACPWDYSGYKYNFLGLICLEYAPAWLTAAFCQDQFADYLLRIKVADSPSCKEDVVMNGYESAKIKSK